MEKYCRNLEEFLLLLAFETQKLPPETGTAQFISAYEDWKSWSLEFLCLTLFMLRAIEKRENKPAEVQQLLKTINDFDEVGYFLSFEGIDANFVEYMLSFRRSDDLSIDEQLLNIYHSKTHHLYGPK